MRAAHSFRRALRAASGLLYILSGSCLTAVAAPLSASAPGLRESGDWLVACDNTHMCEALSAPVHGLGGTLVVYIHEAPGAAGQLSVTLDYPDALANHVLLLDGEPAVGQLRGNSNLLQGSAAVQALNAWRSGQYLQVQDDPLAQVSMAGLTAALAMMDAAQKRNGTNTALIEPGAANADQVPEPIELPKLQPFAPPPPLSTSEVAALTQAWQALPNNPLGVGDPDDLQIYALNAHEALLVQNAQCPGANCESALFRFSHSAPVELRPWRLPAWPGGAVDAHMLPGVMSFDAATGRLSYVHERDFGDCGTRASWIFAGYDFQLADFSAMPRCAGIMPADWPGQWRTDHSQPRGAD